jgi:hypothetical protein
MTDERPRTRLADIEAIAPAPDADDAEELAHEADRAGMAAAATLGSTPAVGVAAEEMDDPPSAAEPGEREEPRRS